jgi:ubiquinone/menaquinone biosynthesis C-methylase UbiE
MSDRLNPSCQECNDRLMDAQASGVIRFYGTHPISENVILAKVAARRSSLDALTEDALKDFDQDHCGGTEVLDALAGMGGAHHQHHVLAVGSGMRGPSRWPAYRRGCRVTGLHITGSWVEAAKRLSQRVRLDHLVDFVRGDATGVPLPDSCYDELIEKENAVSSSDADKVFTDSISKLYEMYLVPLIFRPYAADLASRVASRSPSRVLEIAAGTGVVTRSLASILPESVSIVATDLNQPMLDLASAIGTTRPLEWRQADAMQLPFADGAFDVVACQFGVMFFPDKPKAFSEARRVLKAGGAFVFNVWDRIEENEFAHTVTAALESLFAADPPRFLARTPHGYHDLATIERDLDLGGFSASPQISTVAARSHAASPRIPAIAYCQGTPLRNEIEARDKSRLADATDVAAQAISQRFGPGPVDGKIQAHVVAIERS